MTALSLVYPVQNMINAIAIGFGVGINALIALYSARGTAAVPIPPPPTAWSFPSCTA